MADFSLLFAETKGLPVKYKDKTLRLWDFIPISKGDEFQVTFEKTNSEWKQGIHLSLIDKKGEIKIFDHIIKRGILLWRETVESAIRFEVIPKKNKDCLEVWNIWDPGRGFVDSGRYGAAMIREDIENGARYYCNDGHPDDNFDDIVFTLVKTKGVWETPLEKSPLRK